MTILNSNPVINFPTATFSVLEANTNISIPVMRGGLSQVVSVNYLVTQYHCHQRH